MLPMIVLTGDSCGYCKKAKMLIKRALEKNSAFNEVDISYISESSPEAAAYPHRLLPAFYAGGKLRFEGNPSMQVIELLLSFCREASES
jgi:glutaredoxin